MLISRMRLSPEQARLFILFALTSLQKMNHQRADSLQYSKQGKR